jgi:hypothetical protein
VKEVKNLSTFRNSEILGDTMNTLSKTLALSVALSCLSVASPTHAQDAPGPGAQTQVPASERDQLFPSVAPLKPVVKNDGGFFGIAAISIGTEFWSKYIFSNGFVAHDAPVSQTNFRLTLEGGLYVNLWGSVALADRDADPNYGDEVDYTVGYVTNFGEKDGITLDVSLSYYDLADVFVMPQGDVVQFAAEISKPFEFNAWGTENTLSPYLRGELVFGLDGENQGALYAHLGVRHRIQLWENFSFNQRLTMVYDSGDFGFESGFVPGYGAAFTWHITPTIDWDIRFKATFPIGDTRDDRDTEWAIGSGIRWSF